MAIREIRMAKDEILYKRCREVEIVDDKITQLINDMIDTMYKYDGIGLAACQVGVLKRIITYDVDYIEDGKSKNPQVIINPVIVKTSKNKVTTEEGCLSFPDFFGSVDRYEWVEIEGYDVNFKKIKIKAKDIKSVVLQHEVDHLDGNTFNSKAYDTYYGEKETKKSKKKK